MDSSEAIVQMREVNKQFTYTKALDNVTLDIRLGTITGIIGANGAGKSTLLRTIIGMYLPDSGRVTTFGCEAKKLGPKELEQIGYVHQEGKLISFMTVGQMIRYVKAFYIKWNEALEQKFINDFELNLSEKIKNLSPGQRQRLSVLLAMCFEPALLLLDEPVSALDPVARAKFLDLLPGMIQTQGRAIVISSHILSDIEKIIDYVIVMKKGKILCDCELDELREKYAKVKISSLRGMLPETLPFEGVVDCNRNSTEAIISVTDYNGENLREQAARIGCEAEILPMTLEEIYRVIVR
jgi:ABC-2 type transport system ATP-binding protein